MPKGNTQSEKARDDDKKYNGALYLYRRDLTLLRDHKLNAAEYGHYNALLRCTVWDDKKDNFGAVFDNKTIARLTGKAVSTVWRWKEELLEKGLLKKFDDGTTRWPEFWKHKKENVRKFARGDIAGSHNKNAGSQRFSANSQKNSASLQKYTLPARNSNPSNFRPTKSQTGTGIASLQSMLASKETINKHKEIKKEDIAFSCEVCHRQVTKYEAGLLERQGYKDKICWPCIAKQRNEDKPREL